MTLVVPRIVSDISYVTRISHDSYFAWQAKYLVMLNCHFAWQAQYLVMLNCHFSWQAQYSVKFGMIAGARNVVFFNRKCSWRARKVTSVARRVAADGFLLGSFSDHSRIGPALEMTFQLFSRNFFEMLESHFAWQAQYSLMFQDDTGCSAHWK